MRPRALWATTAVAALGLLGVAGAVELYLRHVSSSALRQAAAELDAAAAAQSDSHYAEAVAAIQHCLKPASAWWSRNTLDWHCVDRRYRERNADRHVEAMRLAMQRLLIEQQRIAAGYPLAGWFSPGRQAPD